MADRWLQLEVLRELDDANATYFALTLGECTSHHYLVSIQWLCLLPCVFDFARQVVRVLAHGHCAPQTATMWMVYRSPGVRECSVEARRALTSMGLGELQEIPATFTAKTGWPSCEDCALVTSISTRKEWPLRIRRLPDAHRGISAVSIGGGWARFIADQHLGVGAFLTFEVVDSRRLVVALHRCSAPTDYSPLHQHRFDAALVRDCLQREPPEVDTLNPMPSDSLSPVRGNDRPHFQKMLRKAHMKKYASNKLVSAHLEFTQMSPIQARRL